MKTLRIKIDFRDSPKVEIPMSESPPAVPAAEIPKASWWQRLVAR